MYKYCVVPRCTNTTVTAPRKIFITLPKSTGNNLRRRKAWLSAMRRNPGDISDKTTAFVCEDHFNFEEDLENYIKFKYSGGPIHIKPDVVPHIFKCQTDRKRTFPKAERPTSIKRARQNIVDSILIQAPPTKSATTLFDEIEVSANKECLQVPEFIQETSTDNELIVNQPTTEQTQFVMLSKGIQCRPRFRSKFIQCTLLMNQEKKPVEVAHVACSPIQTASVLGFNVTVCDTAYPSSSEVTLTDTFSEKYSSQTSSPDKTVETYMAEDHYKKLASEWSTHIVTKKSKFYLGIPEESIFLIELLLQNIKCTKEHIFITLKKIRLNCSFQELADDFGISPSAASKCFNKTLDPLAQCLKEFIIWPHKQKIKKMLPIAFRCRYSDVQSIIDCFEIQIEKPADPIKQALSWSEYKKCNTMKFLISSTPDGLINFVSGGFGGRTSDAVIVKHSGYLNILPRECSVMADRGFKRIDMDIQNLNCKLVRPPSVQSGIKSSKIEVLETKRIAALRIHIERVIGRLREFKMLKPHVCINKKLIRHLDNIVLIACSLINIQSDLIKK